MLLNKTMLQPVRALSARRFDGIPATFSRQSRYAIVLLPILAFTFGSLIPRQASAANYNHPGLATSKSDIEFIKGKLKAKAQPWTSGIGQVRKQIEPYKGKTYAWEVYKHSEWNIPGAQVDLMKDSYAAYGYALLWALEGNRADAEEAIKHVNAWAYKLKRVDDPGASKLPLGWSMPALVHAAELLSHTYDGWKKEDQEAFGKMVRNILLPVVSNYTNNNNWKSWQNHLTLSIGIWLDDKKVVDEALLHLKKQIPGYIKETGKSAETCRDMRHAQMGIAPLVGSAEIMWKQGVDVYSDANNRLLAGAEYHAGIVMGEKVTPDPGCTLNERDYYWPFYEMVFNHYNHRMGMATPRVGRMVSKHRPEPYHRTGWGSLLHHQLPGGSKPDRAAGATTALLSPESPRPAAAPEMDGAGQPLWLFNVLGARMPAPEPAEGSVRTNEAKRPGAQRVSGHFLSRMSQGLPAR